MKNDGGAVYKEMTDEQIDNMRKVMVVQFGPIALIMPKEEIIRYRDRLNAVFAARDREEKT